MRLKAEEEMEQPSVSVQLAHRCASRASIVEDVEGMED